jgi:hypothetical protein
MKFWTLWWPSAVDSEALGETGLHFHTPNRGDVIRNLRASGTAEFDYESIEHGFGWNRQDKDISRH